MWFYLIGCCSSALRARRFAMLAWSKFDRSRRTGVRKTGGRGSAVSDRNVMQKAPPSHDILRPALQRSAVIYASPHSGDYYPPQFIAESLLDPLTLRRSEDSFVDALFGTAPEHGSPLLRARFARVYLDVNREPYELDPAMFRDDLPPNSNTTSLRVAGGLGTIARVVSDGAEVYRDKLSVADAEHRLDQVYYPYHAALAETLNETRNKFGFAVLIDCHSMPSVGGPMDRDGGLKRPDIVLGDRFGTSCTPALIDFVHRALSRLGYAVGRNTPYAGGFTTHHYGRPSAGLHALQIEINRGLYMDEAAFTRLPEFERLARHMTTLIAGLAGFEQNSSLAAE